MLWSTANLNLEVLQTGTRKLVAKWVCPITEHVGPLAYQLKLPASTIVHDIFHVCYLKPYRDDGRTKPPPVPGTVDDEPESEVDSFEESSTIATPREAIRVSSNTCHALLAMVLSMTCGNMMFQTVLSWSKSIGIANLSLSIAMHLYV